MDEIHSGIEIRVENTVFQVESHFSDSSKETINSKLTILMEREVEQYVLDLT